jgi:hypothetical protein
MRNLLRIALVAALAGTAGCNQSPGGNGSASAPEAASKSGPAAGTKRFVNNPANNFSAAMKEKYVDFAFDYPEGWEEKIDPSESNFVQVLAPSQDDISPFVFAVGNATATGPSEQRRQMLQSLLPQFEQQFGSSFEDFDVKWRGERQIGRHRTLGIGFTGRVAAPAGTLNAAGRIDIIVPEDQERGVTLISVALSPDEAPAPEQFESLPEFRTIYDSLRVGKEAK